MIGLEAMNITSLKSALSLVTGQLNTYKGLLASAKAQYNNCMSKLRSARETLASAEFAYTAAKTNVSTSVVNSPIPNDLLEIPTSSPDVAVSTIESASIVTSKLNAQSIIDKFETKVEKLEDWKSKIEARIQALNDKANNLVSQAQSTATNMTTKVQESAKGFITKVTSGSKNTVETYVSTTSQQLKDNLTKTL